MKLYTIILTTLLLVSCQNSFAQSAPLKGKGQAQGTYQTIERLQTPNSSVTVTGDKAVLIETDPNNLLVNKGFEHQTYSTGWTFTAGSTSVDTTNYYEGAKSASIALTAVTGDILSQCVTPTGQKDGTNLENAMRVKTTLTNLQVCSILGTTEQQCINVPPTNRWELVSATSVAVSGALCVKLKSSSSATGTVKVDDSYIGLTRIIGSTYNKTEMTSWVPTTQGLGTIATTSCFWKQGGKHLIANCFITNGTTTANEVRIGLPGSLTVGPEFATVNRTCGYWNRSVAASNSNKAGPMLCKGGDGYVTMSVDANPAAINPLVPQNGNTIFGNGESWAFTLMVTISGWTEGDLTMNSRLPVLPTVREITSTQVYTPAIGVSNIRVVLSGAGGGGGGGGTSVQTAGGAGGSSSYGSLVTVTGGGGGAQGNTAAGNPLGGSGGTCTINSPAVGFCYPGGGGGSGQNMIVAQYAGGGYGGQNIFAGAGPGTYTGAGSVGAANSGSGGGGGGTTTGPSQSGAGGGAGGVADFMVYNPTAVTITIGTGGSAGAAGANGQVGALGTAGKATIIEYYQNGYAPILFNGFTSDYLGSERIQHARVTTSCTSSPCTIAFQNGSWLTNITRTSAGFYVANFTAGYFTSAPDCWVRVGAGTDAYFSRDATEPTTSSWSFYIGYASSIGATYTTADAPFKVFCMGPR